MMRGTERMWMSGKTRVRQRREQLEAGRGKKREGGGRVAGR
ncbi:MAG: hypothetical protein NVS3B14_17950 [Ktedonobacteraceae bacterium]